MATTQSASVRSRAISRPTEKPSAAQVPIRAMQDQARSLLRCQPISRPVRGRIVDHHHIAPTLRKAGQRCLETAQLLMRDDDSGKGQVGMRYRRALRILWLPDCCDGKLGRPWISALFLKLGAIRQGSGYTAAVHSLNRRAPVISRTSPIFRIRDSRRSAVSRLMPASSSTWAVCRTG